MFVSRRLDLSVTKIKSKCDDTCATVHNVCHAARTTYETEQNSISILRQRFVPEYRDLVNRPRARTATTLHP